MFSFVEIRMSKGKFVTRCKDPTPSPSCWFISLGSRRSAITHLKFSCVFLNPTFFLIVGLSSLQWGLRLHCPWRSPYNVDSRRMNLVFSDHYLTIVVYLPVRLSKDSWFTFDRTLNFYVIPVVRIPSESQKYMKWRSLR